MVQPPMMHRYGFDIMEAIDRSEIAIDDPVRTLFAVSDILGHGVELLADDEQLQDFEYRSACAVLLLRQVGRIADALTQQLTGDGPLSGWPAATHDGRALMITIWSCSRRTMRELTELGLFCNYLLDITTEPSHILDLDTPCAALPASGENSSE